MSLSLKSLGLLERINNLEDWQRDQVLVSLLVDTIQAADKGDTKNLDYIVNEIEEYEKDNKGVS